ncbi:MAG TPA: hypothetical protein EYQ42_11660 [Thiotrichaceae bacterium]|jgi:hypothetical protein|nr:hypothetical protein [Thiotrichaceae bacterium]
MSNKSISLFLITLLFSLSANAVRTYEATSELNAAAILPAELLSGPNHQVDSVVINDGYLNIYTIRSKYGEVQATSTAKLRKYIHEINAAARMEAVKGTDEFKSGIKEKVGDVVAGAKGLVTHPIDTLDGAISGVGKLFSRGKENLFGDARSDSETSRTKDLIGFSKTKRDYGFEFGVDVYSRNPILQEQLDDITWAGFGGSVTMSALLMSIPGGTPIISVTGGTELMNKVFRDSAPADLRKLNRENLESMGVSEDISDLFISNANYTPREQTLLVNALASMKNTKQRSEYIKFAILTDNADMAFFRQQQAQMYAGYNKSVKPVKEFISIREISVAKSSDNKIVFNVPLDYMVWTKGLETVASIITQEVARMKDVTGREIWVTGKFSPLAKENLGKMGWTINEGAQHLLD